MHKKTIVWDVDRTILKIQELVEPGVIGFYRSVEITEVIGVQGKVVTNFLTLAVAEPLESSSEDDGKPVFLNKKRPKLLGTDFNVGIVRYRLSLRTFLEKIAEFGSSGQWRPTGAPIQTGTLIAVPPQFVPSDGNDHHPWNGVLKNNFFEGAHVLELFDTTKTHLRFLFEDSRKLTNLAQIVNNYLPMKVDGISDRLGNIIIQLPVTVVSTAVLCLPEADHSVTVAWHPDAPPRSVRISAEIWQDSTVTSFDSAVADAGIAKLQLNSPNGGARTLVWDEKRHILLSATPPLDFMTSLSFSMSVVPFGTEPRNRKFLLADSTGKKRMQSLALIPPAEPTQLIGSVVDAPREPWVSQRVFGESVTSLKARKEFVQYGIDEATKQHTTKKDGLPKEHSKGEDMKLEGISRKYVKRLTALEDLWWLMKEHGTEGVWLWDPFLNAEDVLHTLFFCPHNKVPLRALTAGKAAPEFTQQLNIANCSSEQARQRLARERAGQERQEQAAQLEAAKGNCHGLQLEFRIREGGAGWGFHDRFIIFPRAQGSALAWSLGTSINSFGDEHHILQKVSHGEPIAQAFQDLWGQLEGADYLIWKTSTNEEEKQ